MPQAAAGAVVAWLAGAGASAATMIAAYYAVVIIVTVAINYGLSQLTQALAGKPRRGQQFGAGTGPSRDVTARSTIEPMQLVYGQVRTPGFMAFFATAETDNRFLHFVIALAGHQCEEISDIWLDNRVVPAADINVTTGAVSTTAFQGAQGVCLWIWKYLGTSTQTVDASLNSSAAEWTSSHRGAGVCYIHLRLDRSEKVWPTGAPQNIFALVKGRRLYDPRLDSTNGGSGSQRYTDATTWTWSQNWALCVRDYISGGSRWYNVATPEPRLGFAESNTRIDDSYTTAAANTSDENVAIPVFTIPPTTSTQKRYTCDVQLSCGDIHRDNLESMLTGGVGQVTYVNGQYRIHAGTYDTPTVSLVEDDILGPVTISTHPSGDENYNFVTGTFYDEDRDWSQSPFPNITNASYETQDRGQYKRTIKLPATRTSIRAQRIAMLHLQQSRNKITVRFDRLSPKAMDIAQNETFTVTISEYGWTSKVFRCVEWQWLPEGYVAISAREETSSFYTDPLTTDYASGTNVTVATPQYDLPTTPVSFTVTPRVQSVHLQWDYGVAANSNTTFNVYEYTASTPFASATKIWSGKTLSYDVPLTAGQTRYYWVTATLNGVESSATPAGAGTAGVSAGAGSVFVARGNCIVGDAVITKVGGTTAWDSDCYSIHGYSTCHVVFKGNETTAYRMVGLNQDPTTDEDYASLDFAFYPQDTGVWGIYESGVSKPGSGSYTTKTEFAITYDGTNVRYYIDRVLIRTTASAGLTLYMDSSFYTPGGGVNSIIFGPTTNLELTDTPQLGIDAASDLSNSQPANGTVNFPVYSSGSTFVDRRTITSASWANSTSQSVEVEVSYSILCALNGSNPTGAIGQFMYGEYDTGGGSTTDGADSLKIPTTDYVTRSGSMIVTVSAGVTISARIMASMIGPGGTFNPADVNFSGASLSIKARKR